MPESLSRSLNQAQLVIYGVGIIVGAGIYTILGSASGIAGSAVWASLLVAAAVAFLTALSYCELTSMFPEAGAEYQFVKAAFPAAPLLPFLVGLLIALNASASAATVALAFGGYLGVFAPVPPVLAAVLLLAACTALNISGIQQATWASIGLIVIEVGGLLVLTAGGLATGRPGDAIVLPATDQGPAILAAAALVFFVYLGFEDIANLAEEARHPRTDVPRAMLASLVITTLLYLLVTWSVLAVVQPADLAASSAPLSLVAGRISPALGPLLAVSALVATASTALIALVSISRLLYGMARGGHMPLAMARILPGRRTPWVAALVLFGASCAMLLLRDVKLVASVSALGILVVFTVVHCALIALRVRRSGQERGFRVRLAIGPVPVPAAVGLVANVALITQFDARAYLVLAATLVAGLPFYVLLRRPRP